MDEIPDNFEEAMPGEEKKSQNSWNCQCKQMIISVVGDFASKLLDIFYDFQDKFCNFSPMSDELLPDLDKAHGETLSGPYVIHELELILLKGEYLDRNPWKIIEYFAEIFEYVTSDLQRKLAKKNNSEIPHRLELWQKVT